MRFITWSVITLGNHVYMMCCPCVRVQLLSMLITRYQDTEETVRFQMTQLSRVFLLAQSQNGPVVHDALVGKISNSWQTLRDRNNICNKSEIYPWSYLNSYVDGGVNGSGGTYSPCSRSTDWRGSRGKTDGVFHDECLRLADLFL